MSDFNSSTGVAVQQAPACPADKPKKKRGGKRKAKTAVVEAPVQPAPIVETKTKNKRKRKTKAPAEPVAPTPVVAATPAAKALTTKTKKKAKKINPAGKRPASAYVLFAREQRKGRFSKTNTDLSFTDISKATGKLWREMSDDQKARFNAEAKKDNDAYKLKQSLIPRAPSKPINAFMHFAHQTRPQVTAEFPTLSIGKVQSELGRRWKLLSEAEQQPFKAMNQKQKDEYNDKLEAYQKAFTAHQSKCLAEKQATSS